MSEIDQAAHRDLPGDPAREPGTAWDAFDLHALVEQVRSVLTVAARAKGIALTVRVSPTLPAHVIGDSHHFLQALAAVLENAISSTDRGEVVASISGDAPRRQRLVLSVEVSDTGAGADAEALRAAEAARLALTRTLVEQMDGRFEWAHADGTGSTCRFTLPLGLPKPRLAIA